MDPIYLDHAAATPLRPEVREAMLPLQMGILGNASSVHRWGRIARRWLESARERIGATLGVPPADVHFVRGGTEAINLAILGRAAAARAGGRFPGRFLRSTLEHSAVREALESLERLGNRVDVIPIDRNGEVATPLGALISLEAVELVSVQWVNHETGIILPISEIAEICAETETPLHVDGVQAVGRIPLELNRIPVPLLSLSGHKIGGPPGTGILVVRRDTELSPILFGGGQEGGLRPGTEDVAGAVGLALALEMAVGLGPQESARILELRDHLERTLISTIPGIRVHGGEAKRAPHILGIGIPGLPRDVLPGALDLEDVGVSAGSACRSGSAAPSPVLEALYGQDAAEFAPLRISLGWTTTKHEIDVAAGRIRSVVERMFEAGVGA